MRELPISSQYIHTTQGKVRTHISGTGNVTILLSPDPPNILEHYEDLISTLSKSFRVVAFEPIGFGFSHPSYSFDFNLDSYSRLIDELLTETNTSEVVIALPCIFGYAAIKYLMDFDNEHVKGLVLLQTPNFEEGKNWIERIDRKNRLRRRGLGQVGVWFNTKNIQKRWYDTAEPDVELREKYLKISKSVDLPGYNFCLASPVQSLYRTENIFDGVKLNIPTIIMWGQNDKSHPNTDPHSAGKYFKNSRLELVEHAGHFPEMSSMKNFIESINELINQ